MPNPDELSLDSTIAATDGGLDGSPSDAALPDQSLDALVVAVQNLDCHEYDPEVFGLTAETSQDVQFVLSGRECKPIYLSPQVAADCSDQGEFPVNSQLQFEGTLLVMENPTGFTLNEGQLLYKAVQTACTRFPEAEVKAIGFKFKPMGLSDAEIQVRLENGTYGELLARVHIWKGEGKVETIEGEEIISLLANQQALIDENGKVQELIEFDPARDGSVGQGADSKKKIGVPQKGDKGCNTSPALPGGMDPLLGAVMLALIGKNIHGRVKNIFK